MSLKQPNMSSGVKKNRCCSGPNKDKAYEANDPCGSDDLIFDERKCDCVECVTSKDCYAKGYPSCYECVNGQCVEGPKCCANLPGTQQALYCGGPVDESTCCQYDTKHYLLQAPGGDCWSAARWAGQPSTSRNCWTSSVGAGAMYVSMLSCEEPVFLVSVQTKGPSWNTHICKDGEPVSPLPGGSYVDNTRWHLYASSPAGMIPRNGVRDNRASHLEAVTGVPSASGGGFMSPGYNAPCASGARGIIGPSLNLPGVNDAYYGGSYCVGAQQPTPSEFYECGSHGVCACTGQQYLNMLNGTGSFSRSCEVCSGNGQWVRSGYGNCYILA